jgi:hypothetical protein
MSEEIRKYKHPETTPETYTCEGCQALISEKVAGFSANKFGKMLCMNCQKGAKALN